MPGLKYSQFQNSDNNILFPTFELVTMAIIKRIGLFFQQKNRHLIDDLYLTQGFPVMSQLG